MKHDEKEEKKQQQQMLFQVFQVMFDRGFKKRNLFRLKRNNHALLINHQFWDIYVILS